MIGLLGRHETTQTKVLMSTICTLAVDMADVGYVLSILNSEGHWK